ncbi:glycosyltransferase family 2 protein [Shouchella clausii]|jgi:polyisoprenyl-phosphate glycosyltransferase|uniref:Glycosyltransferase n=1 Tax=Shouchella clausii TaxID=79880 RepID=A0A268RYX5_SHOCL|nr:glycosyltransferase family 2 protein [Shouchella clausii]PAD41666.1 glycosyltransferase [Bacillus sp. 7520-S]SPT81827.1 stress response protein [Niallia circulans]AST94776.1 glycosyltransferase [Shouchella clausii]MBU8597797.1 glycosyltransferase family 2 protein [Shouchella clausii]MCM3550185.1 glycosyltransferase family 2 protein [Shouchella clausii]
MNKPLLSVIVPSFNEEENVEPFYFALRETLKDTHYRWEVIYIDDGSSDGTLPLLQRLSTWHPQVHYVSFTRNFGKEAAIVAGFQHAKGDCVVVIDADLQHPVHLIKDLLEGFEEGYDQVIACRDRKGEGFFRSTASKLYYKFINKIVDVELEDGVGDFRLLSRRAVDALLIMSEGNRFSKGLFSWIGFDQKVVYYENVSRQNGESKWSFSKLVNYGIDGIVSFNMKPLRICFYMGGFILAAALLYIFIMFAQIIRTGIDVPGYFTIISAVLFLGGVQLVSLGIIGEYIGRIYNETKRRPHYLVKETNATKGKRYERAH